MGKEGSWGRAPVHISPFYAWSKGEGLYMCTNIIVCNLVSANNIVFRYVTGSCFFQQQTITTHTPTPTPTHTHSVSHRCSSNVDTEWHTPRMLQQRQGRAGQGGVGSVRQRAIWCTEWGSAKRHSTKETAGQGRAGRAGEDGARRAGQL